MQYYGDLLRKLTKSNTTDVCEFFTKKCLSNAKSRSKNEAMKRFFMISAVSANDGLKELFKKAERQNGSDNERHSQADRTWPGYDFLLF